MFPTCCRTSTAQLGRSEKKLQELREKINNLSSWMDNAAAEMENTVKSWFYKLSLN